MEKINILGVNVSAIDMPMALDVIEGWIARRERHYVTITGVHGIIESQADDKVRHIHNRAGLVTPDGMPLVWLSRLNGHRHVARVCGTDLMLVLCSPNARRRLKYTPAIKAKGNATKSNTDAFRDTNARKLKRTGSTPNPLLRGHT